MDSEQKNEANSFSVDPNKASPCWTWLFTVKKEMESKLALHDLELIIRVILPSLSDMEKSSHCMWELKDSIDVSVILDHDIKRECMKEKMGSLANAVDVFKVEGKFSIGEVVRLRELSKQWTFGGVNS